jgi:CRP/FNR family cyclic AMP-dependent transcriptional regulator
MTTPDRDTTSSDVFSHETVRSYADGETIFSEGDSGRDLYIVQRGAVEIRKHTSNGEIALASFGRGHFFGELALLHSLPRSASAVAVGATRLLVLQPGGFLLKIRRDPTFAFEMIQQLSHRVKVSNDRLVSHLEHAHDLEEPAK